MTVNSGFALHQPTNPPVDILDTNSPSQGTPSSLATTPAHSVATSFTTTRRVFPDLENESLEGFHFLRTPREYKSPHWKHFRLLDPAFHPPKDPSSQYALCLFCKKSIKIGKGVSGLGSHLRSHEKNEEHRKEMESTLRNQKRQFETSLNATPKLTPAQRDAQILEATACWVVEENLPFNAVEKESFRQLCSILYPKAPALTANQIRAEIKSLGTTCKQAIVKELSGRHFALTTDHWTSKNNETYGALTAHYIVDGELKRCVLHFEVHHGTTTGEALFANLVSIFEGYNFDMSYILAVTTDTTGNMNTFGRRLAQHGVNHLYCMAHNLQLTVKYAFDDKNIPDSENAMKSARSQVDFFNSSTQALEKLINMQKTTRQGARALKPIQDVRTRWWSTHKMVDRLLLLTPSIDALVASGQVKVSALTPTQKKVLNEIKDLLSPFASAQKKLEGDKYPTVSMVPYLVWKIRKHLKARAEPIDEGQITSSTRQLSQIMYRDFVENRYGDGSTVFHDEYVLGNLQRYISLNKIVLVASFLDPRFKSLHPFVPAADKQKIISYVLSLMASIVEKSADERMNTNSQQEESIDDERMNVNSQQEESESSNLLPDHNDDIDESDDMFADLVEEQREPQAFVNDAGIICEAELQRYRSTPQIPFAEDALKWWSNNSLKFPILSVLAFRYLSIPATSAASERLWSLANQIITKNRTQLEGNIVRDLIFLKENGHILGKHAEEIEGRVRLLPMVSAKKDDKKKARHK
mmetsp:Transcript_12832/g.25980  ORF Transcript_12832/g.25980 Transcript_12832/m.25980 type:complete len:754 (-) Transcript_12832:39-2300(-)